MKSIQEIQSAARGFNRHDVEVSKSMASLTISFHFLWLLNLILFIPAESLSQVVLRGKVYDAKTSEPVPFAIIAIPSEGRGTQSGLEGDFVMTVTASLPCTISISMIGYTEQLLEVNSTKFVSVFLQQDEILLAEAVVIGSRQPDEAMRNPRTQVTMDRLAIRSTPSLDVYSAMGTQQEIDVASPSLGFKVLNTRGFSSTAPVRMLQLIDGVDNQSPGLNFSLGNFLGVSELDLQRMDVIVGASTPLYGPNAFNGVIDMKTLDPFLHQGLSMTFRAGERGLLEGALRYAHAFRNRQGHDLMALKVNLYGMRAYDWVADNTDPVSNSEVEATNPGGYNAVNIYGDEFNFDYSSQPFFYPALGVVHRTGYHEKDLVNYDSYNIKGSLSLQFRTAPKKGLNAPEIILATSTGSGTTVFQGDNRFSLQDIRFFQHRLEWRKRDRFFIRSYFTHEDAGDSYDPFFTAHRIQQLSNDNSSWQVKYADYWRTYVVPRNPLENPDSLFAWHQEARNFADKKNIRDQPWVMDLPTPGSDAFREKFDDITGRLNNEDQGTRFYDRSALLHVHGEYTWHTGFFRELKAGGSYRLYLPDSKGTIFHDTAGTVIRNMETGWYAGARKGMLKDEKLTASVALRLDKNENFNWVSTQSFGLVYELPKETFLRASFSSAIRNPTLTDQYMYLNVGPAILAGHLDAVDSLITLASFDTFRQTLVVDLLEYFSIPSLRPEKVRTFEAGARGKIGSSLSADLVYYRNQYRDFLGYQIGIRSDFYPPPFQLPRNTQVFRYSANSASIVTTEGWSFGLQYDITTMVTLKGNYSFNVLRKTNEEDPIIPAFNTPRHKFNLGMIISSLHRSSSHWLSRFSLGANYKWVEGFRFEGSPQFTGDIPSYGVVDAQMTYTMPDLHMSIKAGASNVLNNLHYETYGGPLIGRMAYVMLRFDLNRFQ